MLGTIRPTQRQYLGCLPGSIIGDTVWIEAALPASDMKQLQLAVAGTCDSIPRLLGTWHTHPYHADPLNLPVKERWLSPQDLRTFAASADRVTLARWDVDSLDAAVKFATVVTTLRCCCSDSHEPVLADAGYPWNKRTLGTSS